MTPRELIRFIEQTSSDEGDEFMDNEIVIQDDTDRPISFGWCPHNLQVLPLRAGHAQ